MLFRSDVYQHNGTRTRCTGYCTEVFFNAAMAWLQARQRQGEPFFLYLPTNAPHSPLWVPEEDRLAVEAYFAQREHLLPQLNATLRANIIRFLAMIRNLDTHVGRLRTFLDAQGLARDTILIFMTDNGSTFGHSYYNAGMRGSKCTLWEGGHRVPCFVHWPGGGLRAPRDVPGLTQVQDILPTLVELCAIARHPGPFDGDRKSTRLNSSHRIRNRMPSSA